MIWRKEWKTITYIARTSFFTAATRLALLRRWRERAFIWRRHSSSSTFSFFISLKVFTNISTTALFSSSFAPARLETLVNLKRESIHRATTYLLMKAASRITRERRSLASSLALASRFTKMALNFSTTSAFIIFSAFLLSNPRIASIRYTQLATTMLSVLFSRIMARASRDLARTIYPIKPLANRYIINFLALLLDQSDSIGVFLGDNGSSLLSVTTNH